MTKLDKYLQQIQDSLDASYTIGTQAPAFREDCEVLLEMLQLQHQCISYFTNASEEERQILFDDLESLIPNSEDE